jgi:hypothetical protein
MSHADDPLVAYCEETQSILDAGGLEDDVTAGAGRIRYMRWSEAVERLVAAWRTEPVEIRERDWREALHCLPPLGWCRSELGESFKLAEPVCEGVVTIYVHRDGRYFRFNDSMTLHHALCCKRTGAVLDNRTDAVAHDTPAPAKQSERLIGEEVTDATDRGR